MTRRDRRALVAGGVVVLLAVIGLRLAPSGVRWVLDAQRDLTERSELLARTRAEVAAAGVLEDSARALTSALVALAPRLLGGASPAEAQVELAGLVNLAASRHNVKLERVDPLPDSRTGARLARIRAHAAFESDVRGLAAFVRAVAEVDPLVWIDTLRVAAENPVSGGGTEVLHFEVTVAGWHLQSSGSRAERSE